MSIKLALLLSLSLWQVSFAASHMLVIGGGGEPNKPNTIFDNELQNATNFIKRSNWQSRISFNGGHRQTEAIAQSFAAKSGGQNSSFTSENYEALISEYERKIKSGQIKSGDQLLLMISSHGSVNTRNQKTHYISTSTKDKSGLTNYSTLAGSATVSLDRLESLTKLAADKGIKLGILDFSCHSGVTQKLANKNTCVISSTGPNHFAWGGNQLTFAAKFTQNMRSGKSLEDVFLEAVKDKSETSFPMISSNHGNEIQNAMYPLISPYLHDTRSDITTAKMKLFYNEKYSEDRCENLNSDYQELISFTHDIENITSNTNYSKLRTLLSEYNGLQQGIIQSVKVMNSKHNLAKEENFCATSHGLKTCMIYSLGEILNIEVDQMMSLINRQMRSAKGSEQKSLASRLSIYQKIKTRKAQLLSDSSLRSAKSFWDQGSYLKKTQQLANDIAQESQMAYYQTYNTLRKEEGSKGPCAEIKF